MFTALAGIIQEDEEITVKITGVGKDGIMKAVVMPRGLKGKNPALNQPLALAATPQELDEGFIGAILEFGFSRTGLKEQVATTATIMAAAQQAEAGKATKALRSPGPKQTPKPVGAADDGDDDLDGNDNAGNDILDGGSSTGSIAPSTPPAPPPPKATASANDDLLSLM